MKTKSDKLHSTLTSGILAVVCLMSVGCKDTLQLKEQRREVLAQTEALIATSADLDAKLADLRKTLPTASTPKAAAEAMSKVYQQDLDSIAREKALLANRIKAQEERVAALQKEIDDFKALSQMQNPTPPKS